MANYRDDVDKILWCLGPRGRYQLLQYGYIMLCQLSVAFSTLVYVFIGYSPPNQCKNLSQPIQNYPEFSQIYRNETTYSLQYDKCNIEVSWNDTNGTTGGKSVSCLNGHNFHTETDRTIVTEWNLVCNRAGLAEFSQTLITVGQMIGATFFTSLSDRFGRKPVLVTTHILILITTVALAFMPGFPSFAAIRMVIGIIQEGLGLVCSCLSIEIFPKEYRGAITAIGTIWWSVCVTVLTPFGHFLRNYTWRYTEIATALIALPSIGGYWIMDESLRWLIANNKIIEANNVVKRIAKWNHSDANEALGVLSKVQEIILNEESTTDSNALEVSVIRHNGLPSDRIEQPNGVQSSKPVVIRYTVLDLFKDKYLIRLSCIVWYTWCINSLTYYGLFLTSSTFAGDRFLNYFLSGIVELPSAFVFWAIIDRLGRKKTSIFFHGLAGSSLIISVVLLLIKDDGGNDAKASTAFSLIGKFAVTGSLTTIYLSTPELYPTNLRNAAFGMASAAARIGGMAAPYSSFLASYAAWGPGVVFGSCCMVVTLLTLTLPETRRRELPVTLKDAISLFRGKTKTPKL